MRDAGLVSYEWCTEYHRDRGSALHAATALLDEGDLDPESVDPAIEARLRQYDRFRQEVRPEILSIEEPVEHAIYKYCGTLDRRMTVGGSEFLVDIKSGMTCMPAHQIQTAAYKACFDRPMKRACLHVGDDGYKWIEHASRDDWRIFLAALTVADWRKRNGLTE